MSNIFRIKIKPDINNFLPKIINRWRTCLTVLKQKKYLNKPCEQFYCPN